jgi:SsrA-binding protein
MKFQNRKAYHDYVILEKETAGIVLRGSEVRSLRQGKISLAGSFCYIHDGNLVIKNLTIPVLPNSYQHDPDREKILLFTKRQLSRWSKLIDKGITIVPLQIFVNANGLFKVEVGLAKGKKNYDKRQSIKEKEWKRNQE